MVVDMVGEWGRWLCGAGGGAKLLLVIGGAVR